nr:hypothetical protein [Tanacetum cinerariifolium]
MSDLEDSTVTYMEASPSPDYMPSPKELEYAPPLPNFVLELVFLEFMPPEDEVFLTEEQPPPAAVSPTTDSPVYIVISDLEEDPTDYPTDEGEDEDDDDGSFDGDEDDDDVEEDEDEDDEDEEEHPASADSIPPPVYRTTARISIPVTLPPQKRLCITLGPKYEVDKSSSASTARPTGGFRADYGFVATLDDEIRRDLERDVGYGIIDTWDEMLVGMSRAPVTDETELGRRMTDFVRNVRQYTNEISGRLDDTQDDRLLMSGQLNMMRRDRHAHVRTARLMESEARLSHDAWVQYVDASDTVRAEIMSLRTTVLAHQSEITRLRAVDCTQQIQLAEALTLLKILQTHMAALQR